MSWINLYGLVIVVFLLIPNIIYSSKNKNIENKCKNKVMNINEQIGRYGSMFFMVFNIGLYELGFRSKLGFIIWLVSMTVLILLYWLFWILFFIRPKLLISLMLAIIPSIIFVLHGIVISHWLLIICGIIFSVSHIYVTYKNSIR